jgi:hypothetical protein
MKRIMSLIWVFVLLLLVSNVVFAEKLYVLYGFKIGQKISTIEAQLGKPSQVIYYEDGFVAYIYKMADYYVVFEASPSNLDSIWSIQIGGKRNPQKMGLRDINLGDSFEKMIKIFGEPDEKENARDEYTGKTLDDTIYYSYNNNGNYSIEVTNNQISSIKVAYEEGKSTKDIPDLNAIIDALASKDYYKICSILAPNLEIVDSQTLSFSKSIYDSILNDNKINDVLFNPQYGLCAIKENNFLESHIHLAMGGPSGFEYNIKIDKVHYQLLLTEEYDGWVIRRIDILP